MYFTRRTTEITALNQKHLKQEAILQYSNSEQKEYVPAQTKRSNTFILHTITIE